MADIANALRDDKGNGDEPAHILEATERSRLDWLQRYWQISVTSHSPGGLETRRFVGAAYPSRAAAHNAEGATGTTPTHVKDTPAANGDAP
jgi:hypothetical protein